MTNGCLVSKSFADAGVSDRSCWWAFLQRNLRSILPARRWVDLAQSLAMTDDEKKMNGCPKMSELIRASWWRASISHDFRWKGDEYSMKPDDVCDDASLASCWCSRSSAAWWTTGDRQLNQTGMGSLLVVGLSLLDSITHPTQPPFPPPSSLNALIAFQNRISIRGTHR